MDIIIELVDGKFNEAGYLNTGIYEIIANVDTNDSNIDVNIINGTCTIL